MQNTGGQTEQAAERPDTKKTWVRRDIKGYIVFFAVMLFVALIVVAILTLLPTKKPKVSRYSDNGVARNFMFPFVFTDESGNLYIIESSEKKPVPIDDSVTDAVHAAESQTVLYTRNGELFEYEIAGGRRRSVATSVKKYFLTGDGSVIAVIGTDNSVSCIYGKKTTEVSGPAEIVPDNFLAVGQSCVLFMKDFDYEKGTASLLRYTAGGNVTTVAESVSYNRMAGISGDDKYIYYYCGSLMKITDIDGKELCSVEGGWPASPTKLLSNYQSVTRIRQFNANAPVSYIYRTVAEGGSADAVSLLFFNGKTVKTVAERFGQEIYVSSDHSLILYTVPDGNGEYVYRAGNKGNPEKLLKLENVSQYLFDPDSDYLYFRTADGKLYRFNVYSASADPSLVSEVSEKLYKYPKKPFVMFTIPDSDTVNLVHNTNTFIQFDGRQEVLFYGTATDKYLLMRSNAYGSISIDLADSGYFTRIASSVSPSLYFDNQFENILYLSGNKLYLRTSSETVEMGEFSGVVSVDIV